MSHPEPTLCHSIKALAPLGRVQAMQMTCALRVTRAGVTQFFVVAEDGILTAMKYSKLSKHNIIELVCN